MPTLGEAEFKNVRNKLLKPFSKPNYQNLDDACQAVPARKLVILCVWPAVVEFLLSGKLGYARSTRVHILSAARVKNGNWIFSRKWGSILPGKASKPSDLEDPKSRHWILVTHLAKTEKTVTIKNLLLGRSGTSNASTFDFYDLLSGVRCCRSAPVARLIFKKLLVMTLKHWVAVLIPTRCSMHSKEGSFGVNGLFGSRNILFGETLLTDRSRP